MKSKLIAPILITQRLAKGEKFWHYATRDEQFIYATRDAADFDDYIAVIPISQEIKGTLPIAI